MAAQKKSTNRAGTNALELSAELASLVEDLIKKSNDLSTAQRNSLSGYIKKCLLRPRPKRRPRLIEGIEDFMREPVVLAMCFILPANPEIKNSALARKIWAMPHIKRLKVQNLPISYNTILQRVKKIQKIRALMPPAPVKIIPPDAIVENPDPFEKGHQFVTMVWGDDGRLTGYADPD